MRILQWFRKFVGHSPREPLVVYSEIVIQGKPLRMLTVGPGITYISGRSETVLEPLTPEYIAARHAETSRRLDAMGFAGHYKLVKINEPLVNGCLSEDGVFIPLSDLPTPLK